MPSWTLRVGAVIVSALTMLGSTNYVLAHPKNPDAPLQPVVADKPSPTPEPTEPPPVFTRPPTLPPTTPPTPPPATSRPTTLIVSGKPVLVTGTPVPTARPTTPRPTPVPTITLVPGVRRTALPQLTITHTS